MHPTAFLTGDSRTHINKAQLNSSHKCSSPSSHLRNYNPKFSQSIFFGSQIAQRFPRSIVQLLLYLLYIRLCHSEVLPNKPIHILAHDTFPRVINVAQNRQAAKRFLYVISTQKKHLLLEYGKCDYSKTCSSLFFIS